MGVEVTRSEDRSRYELTVDGELAGFSEFRTRAGRMVFTHTEIADAFEGQGLGSRLAREALEDAVARDMAIIPLCPFIARYLDRHDVPGARIETPQR